MTDQNLENACKACILILIYMLSRRTVRMATMMRTIRCFMHSIIQIVLIQLHLSIGNRQRMSKRTPTIPEFPVHHSMSLLSAIWFSMTISPNRSLRTRVGRATSSLPTTCLSSPKKHSTVQCLGDYIPKRGMYITVHRPTAGPLLTRTIIGASKKVSGEVRELLK
ncbi:hypothetical protein CP557_02215 [Natrinema ejinorense]|uniref:Uncharacterized protein n=1 Tax=Natrinema ejinorense TaxID=373386 RepID=A0A2A5QRM2_9EURY|nr:hypothetical protein CP557_02215 [Natrinema ejinorense]